MQQSFLHETLAEALRQDIGNAGGMKVVGAVLWPEIPTDQAAGKLRDATNPERREKLSPDQMAHVMKMSRAVGSHAALTFLCRSTGYADPVAVEPEDERARMQREFVEATKSLAQMAARIERLSAPAIVGRAA